MTDSEKLDKIISEVGEIKTHIAVQEFHRDDHGKRLTKIEKVADNYKSDKAKIIGGTTILAAIIAWIMKHF